MERAQATTPVYSEAERATMFHSHAGARYTVPAMVLPLRRARCARRTAGPGCSPFPERRSILQAEGAGGTKVTDRLTGSGIILPHAA